MKATDIKVGESYQTMIGRHWKIVTVLSVHTKDYTNASGRVTTLYNVRSPAGNTLVRHNAELRHPKPTGPKGLPLPRQVKGGS